MSRSPRRVSGLPLYLIGVLALVLAMGGAATAGALVTSKQIKDNTITTKDVKNGTLLLRDVKRSELAKLRGTNGVNGTNGKDGKDGASAFAPPPSGTVIKGGGVLNSEVSAGGTLLRGYSSLPFMTGVPIDDFGPGRNLFFGDLGGLAAVLEQDTTDCAGTAAAPTATADSLCVYVVASNGVAAASAVVYAGAGDLADAAENSGLFVQVMSSGAGLVQLRYVWVYTAP
jgi:hypothetical protein